MKEANTLADMVWKKDEPLIVGLYAMKHVKPGGDHSTLVRIDREIVPGSFSVEYVQLLRDGSVICGGGSSSWGIEHFTPLSAAWQILCAEYYEAKRRVAQAESLGKQMQHESCVRLAAISSLVRCGSPRFDKSGHPIPDRQVQ